jgi:F420H(2)-dependent quinone reductase
MLKVMFKAMVAVGVFLYRLTGGTIGGKLQTMPVLLLTTIGRKSGRPRTVPLAFLRDGSDFVIIASAYAVLHRPPAWFLNLESHPEATIQVKAEAANPEKRRELWERLMEVAPGYGRYQKRTSREIPMVILHPVEESGETRSA